jgi:D-beta-D-heptose 7-phosphate kinase/D-beta-D-heptose 1-phosphate adenosyltransferase
MNEASKKVLIEGIAQFGKVRVLCLGDLILDTYNEGSVNRISPESPVPVFHSNRAASVPGGGANVAKNISALGGHCVLVGLVGNDSAGELLSKTLQGLNTVIPELIMDNNRRTTHKTRYIAQGQHVVRIDMEDIKPATEYIENQLIKSSIEATSACDVVILSDYAKGTLTDRVLKEVITAAKSKGIPVVVDPKSANFARYSGATVLKPNLKELSAAYGTEVKEDTEVLGAAMNLLESGNFDNLVITRSEMGMTLVQADGTHLHVHSQAREVFDVVGAGDTCAAILALSIASGLNLADSVYLTNMAAGIVVAKQGTATLTPRELIHSLEQLDAPRAPPSLPAFLSRKELVDYANQVRAKGKRIGFTNGVFDIIHPGHISVLNFAKNECDHLIVGINSDRSVRNLNKGAGRPINSQDDRAIVISALSCVDAVTIFDEETPKEVIEAICPDVLIKGADYSVSEVVGSDFVKSYGGAVKLAPIVSGKSSSNIITRMKSVWTKE